MAPGHPRVQRGPRSLRELRTHWTNRELKFPRPLHGLEDGTNTQVCTLQNGECFSGTTASRLDNGLSDSGVFEKDVTKVCCFPLSQSPLSLYERNAIGWFVTTARGGTSFLGPRASFQSKALIFQANWTHVLRSQCSKGLHKI